MTWTLVLIVLYVNAPAAINVDGYVSRATCEEAGQKAIRDFNHNGDGRAHFSCLPKYHK